MLIRSGYQVDAAADGAAGWKALQGNSYDLVITDNFMPKMTGVEMVKKLHAAGMKLPVIMATAMLPQEEFVSHPWLQAVTTLLKPFRANGLVVRSEKDPGGERFFRNLAGCAQHVNNLAVRSE